MQALGGETLVRTRHAQTLTDVRQLSELFGAFEPFGFAISPSSSGDPAGRRQWLGGQARPTGQPGPAREPSPCLSTLEVLC